ncbi:MAG: pilus assembly protein PilM [Erysipelothrix sp.]|nr:pilus assembly protein PilM [Erysipelothrix sp.]
MSLAIEIKNNEIIMVEGKVTKSNIQVRSTHSFEFNENLINQHGIVDTDNFAMVLSSQLNQMDTKEKKCNVCINNSSIIYREILVPKVDEKRLPFLVRSEMMSALHLTPEYLMDFIPLEEVEKDGNPMYRVLAVAILESAIESYVTAFKKANLKINVLDTASNAIIKMMDEFNVSNTTYQFIVADVQKGQLKLYLFDEGIYVLTRNTRLSASGDEQAEIDEIVESISKMSQYTFTRNSKGIHTIVYIGQDAILRQVSESVEQSLNIPGRLFSDIVKEVKNVELDNKYVNAVGVLLRK